MTKNADKAQRLSDLTFDKFKELAQDESLSRYEKIGFFNELREGKEELIWNDLLQKMPTLQHAGNKVLDIGPGCSDLPHLLLNHSSQFEQEVWLIDSKEMLDNLPSESYIHKLPAMFPNETSNWVEEHKSSFNAIIVYSVVHYIALESSLLVFIDEISKLLAPGGMALIADIPNASKRNRFFSSPAGITYHQEKNQTNNLPVVQWNKLLPGEMDDSAVFAMMQRARANGLESYLLPQSSELPMGNRREDLLIIKHH